MRGTVSYDQNRHSVTTRKELKHLQVGQFEFLKMNWVAILICMQKEQILRKLAKLTSILSALVFLGMQFVPTAARSKTSATTAAHMAEVINPQVGAILDRSCQDCHSSRTNWPWYSRVAPVSWIVSKYVSEGRQMLDFSEWPNQRHSEDERMLICDAVRRRNAAARVHGDSSQRQALKAGCRIDLRLGCRPERTQDIAAGQ